MIPLHPDWENNVRMNEVGGGGWEGDVLKVPGHSGYSDLATINVAEINSIIDSILVSMDGISSVVFQ